jgi:hypothetical protein
VAKRPMPDDFIIQVELPWDWDRGPTIKIDLSRPEFESQVLAAAGRFRSLKRQTRAGGRQVVPVMCQQCGEEVKTREIAKHRRERHGRE